MTKASTIRKVDDLVRRYPALFSCRASIESAVKAICDSYHAGKKLITCGNGGSAADAEHIVGELMKGFLCKRRMDDALYNRLVEICPNEAEYFRENLQMALPAISLENQLSLNSAFANDQAPDLALAQQVLGIGEEGDVLLAITTSGNSKNVLYAVQMARAKGLITIALTGRTGGKIRSMADISICAPEDETYRIQEYHLPIYHALCIAAEHEFFEDICSHH